MTREDSKIRQKAIAAVYARRLDLTVAEIAAMFSVTPHMVTYSRKQQGVPHRHPVMAAAKARA